MEQENKEFVNFLFDKLFENTDTEMIDLHDDDSCCDHLEFEQLMEDIDCIVDEMCGDGSEELVAMLCDAVCNNFPAK